MRSIVYGPGSTFEQRVANARVDFVHQLYAPNNLDFAPRFGFAWNPGGQGRTAKQGDSSPFETSRPARGRIQAPTLTRSDQDVESSPEKAGVGRTDSVLGHHTTSAHFS